MRNDGTSRPIKAGNRLRRIRCKQNLTLRQVGLASAAIATQRRNPAFALGISGLYEIEIEGRIPNIYHLYVLAHIYRVDLLHVLDWYGVPRA